MGTKTFDTNCYDLAVVFLEDEAWFHAKPGDERVWLITQLAGEIQETIEHEIQGYRETKGEVDNGSQDKAT